jgi:hypothetical protein
VKEQKEWLKLVKKLIKTCLIESQEALPNSLQAGI